MQKLITSTVAMIAVAALSPIAAKQSGDKMNMTKTYTGCVEAGETAGTYKLAHAMADMDAGVKKDAMKNDAQNEMKRDPMAKDAMASMRMMLSSQKVDLSKHVGHKVTVTGTTGDMAMAKPDTMAKPDGMPKTMGPLTVTSLKMVAATCGM